MQVETPSRRYDVTCAFVSRYRAITLFAAGLAGTYKAPGRGSGQRRLHYHPTQSGDDWKADITFTLGARRSRTKSLH